MFIRKADANDTEACLAMGRAFFAESGYADDMEFDDESAAHTMRQLIEADSNVLLVAQDASGLVGMAAALSFGHYLNLKRTVAQELFWWVTPRARGGTAAMKLMRGLEAWAHDKGAEYLTMVCLDALATNPAARIYERSGYRAAERSFIKRLT